MNFEKMERSLVMTSLAAEATPLSLRDWPAKETDRGGGDTATVNADVAALNWSTDTSRKAPARPDPVDLAALESFPASDPPGWLGITAGAPFAHVENGRAKGRRQ